MSRSVRMQMPFLELLQATSVKQRKALLQTLTKDQFHALCEVIINVYKGSVPVSNYYVKKLFPFKRSIQMLADNHVSPKRKKKILAVKHIIIPWVLKPVLSILKKEPEDIALDSEQEECETNGL